MIEIIFTYECEGISLDYDHEEFYPEVPPYGGYPLSPEKIEEDVREIVRAYRNIKGTQKSDVKIGVYTASDIVILFFRLLVLEGKLSNDEVLFVSKNSKGKYTYYPLDLDATAQGFRGGMEERFKLSRRLVELRKKLERNLT